MRDYGSRGAVKVEANTTFEGSVPSQDCFALVS